MSRKHHRGGASTNKALPVRTHICSHRGEEVKVGPYTILAGGTQYLRPEDFRKADLLVPLTDKAGPLEFGKRYEVLAGCLTDYGGVPTYWKEFLDVVIGELKQGKKVLGFCVGSHGRTGTFIASLIALLESVDETPDPIAAVRERHCSHAVETLAQAEAVFALRGQSLPQKYVHEFKPEQAAKADLASQPQPKLGCTGGRNDQ